MESRQKEVNVEKEKINNFYGKFLEEVYNFCDYIPAKNFFKIKEDISRYSLIVARTMITKGDDFRRKMPNFIAQIEFMIDFTKEMGYASNEKVKKIKEMLKKMEEELRSSQDLILH